jgi:hypothetical protein
LIFLGLRLRIYGLSLRYHYQRLLFEVLLSLPPSLHRGCFFMLLRLTPTLLLLRDTLGFRNGFSFGFDDGLFQDWLAWLKEE